MNDLPDIQNRDDIERVITAFYETLLKDPIIGFFFNTLSTLDLDTHIPKITDFWEFQLFGVRSYRGNAYEAHRLLNQKARMTRGHFHRWLFVLSQTLDTRYAGPNTDLMKKKAAAIAEKMAAALASGQRAVDWDGDGMQYFEPQAGFNKTPS